MQKVTVRRMDLQQVEPRFESPLGRTCKRAGNDLQSGQIESLRPANTWCQMAPRWGPSRLSHPPSSGFR